MMLVLKKKGGAKRYLEVLAKTVLREIMQVRTLTVEATLQCVNLNEISDAEKVAVFLKQQCKIDASSKCINPSAERPG